MPVICDNETLKTRCHALKNAPYITVDTEFLRDKTYFPKLCLIQVAAPGEEAFAIDPLAKGLDMAPFFALLQKEDILKVFHSARQDIEIFLNLTGKVPAPLFDTQVAAMVCGFGESASYATLVQEIVGKTIDKSSRYTDWSRRPLSEKQITYALSDVTHLRGVYEYLAAELEKNNRTAWLKEEMETLTHPDTYFQDPDTAWLRLKPKSHSRRFLAYVRTLAAWREKEAQNLDLPRNHVLRDQSLMEIAAHAPATREELAAIRGLGRLANNRKLQDDVLALIAQTAALPKEDLPQLPKPHRKQVKNLALLELLRVLLKIQCAQFHVAEKLVASAHDLSLIASSDEPEEEIPTLHGWRYEVFGQYAQALKRGEIALGLKGDTLITLPVPRK